MGKTSESHGENEKISYTDNNGTVTRTEIITPKGKILQMTNYTNGKPRREIGFFPHNISCIHTLKIYGENGAVTESYSYSEKDKKHWGNLNMNSETA